eukprot:407627-Amorphochlora_amoeboformis.AAC.1
MGQSRGTPWIPGIRISYDRISVGFWEKTKEIPARVQGSRRTDGVHDGSAEVRNVSGPKRSFNHLTFKEIVQVSNRNTFAQAEEVESFDRLNMSGEKLPSLGELRKKIDACDRQLIKLLNDRMKV